MQGVWLQSGVVEIRNDIPPPPPAAGEALIATRLAGICGTDLAMMRGYRPFAGILGHEFVGVVARSPGAEAWEGQRVVGEINLGCGRCERCSSGQRNHCEERRVLGIRDCNGAFADYLSLPVVNLHRVPDEIDDRTAVFTEPLAAALQVLEQVSVHGADRVLVIGAGRLGQLIARVLHNHGCRLEVVARHQRQRERLEAFGITAISEHGAGGRSYDLVVEATGSAAGLAAARAAVAPRGVVVLKSTYGHATRFDFSRLVVDEITLVGSRCGSFADALRLLAGREVDPAGLVDAVYPLDEAEQALAHAARPGALKVLLRAGSERGAAAERKDA